MILKPEQVESLRIMQAAIERIARLTGAVNAQVESCGIEGLRQLSGRDMAHFYHEEVGRRLELHRMAVAKARHRSAINNSKAA